MTVRAVYLCQLRQVWCESHSVFQLRQVVSSVVNSAVSDLWHLSNRQVLNAREALSVFQDHFGLRPWLIRLYTKSRLYKQLCDVTAMTEQYRVAPC